MRFIGIFAGIGAALLAVPDALGCSVKDPEIVTEQIKSNPNLRKVKGTFHVKEWNRAEDYGDAAMIVSGRIQTQRGTGWDVWLYYSDLFNECGIQRTPPADAEGWFWISRRRARPGGQYFMHMWEGSYLPGAQEQFDRARASL